MSTLFLVGIAFAARLTTTDRDVVPSEADVASDPIINGEDAAREDWPQTGVMLMDATIESDWGDADVRMMVCSSTLIAPDVVLLAAHCLDGDAFTYGYGTLDIHEVRWSREEDLSDYDGSDANIDWPDDSVPAIDWVGHDDFDLFQLQTGVAVNYDIALIFLETPITDVAFAYLPTVDETDQIVEGAEVTVVGWGQQVATSGWDPPPAGSYGIKQMGASTIADIGEAEFQVGATESSVRKCHGDSGGPTFMDIDTASSVATRLIGVTSHAYDESDCDRKGGVDTRVMYYRDWIEEQMVARCEDGTRVWCDESGIPTPPIATVDDEDDDKAGNVGDDEGVSLNACACNASGPGAAWLLAVAGAAALRRRRAG